MTKVNERQPRASFREVFTRNRETPLTKSTSNKDFKGVPRSKLSSVGAMMTPHHASPTLSYTIRFPRFLAEVATQQAGRAWTLTQTRCFNPSRTARLLARGWHRRLRKQLFGPGPRSRRDRKELPASQASETVLRTVFGGSGCRGATLPRILRGRPTGSAEPPAKH